MNNHKKKRPENKPFVPVVHVVFFAIFPILSLYNNNIDLTEFSHVVIPIIISVTAAGALFFLLKLKVKSSHKAGLLTSVFLLLFYSFGFCLDFRAIGSLGSQDIQVYQVALTAWLLLLILPTYFIVKTKRNLTPLTEFLNISSFATVFFVVFLIVGYFLTHGKQEEIPLGTAITSQTIDYPDVYYIVLDAYAREDVLDDLYGFDNSEMIDFLEDKSFFVANKSNSNYSRTYLSMSSSLNMKHLDYLSDKEGRDNHDMLALKKLIKNNVVQKKFKEKGYTLVDVPSQWTDINQMPADITINKKTSLNEFDDVLIGTTPLSLIFGNRLVLNSRRNRILNAFEFMPEIAKIEGPTFSYIHILAPHPPFLFDANGKAVYENSFISLKDGCYYFEINPDRDSYVEKYSNQLTFINKKLQKAITKILELSKNDPIIIIQADHGPRSTCNPNDPFRGNIKEQYSILNAFYIGSQEENQLYDSISPVNSFRVVFNILFNEDLRLLEDKSYFSTETRPYDFFDVTEKTK